MVIDALTGFSRRSTLWISTDWNRTRKEANMLLFVASRFLSQIFLFCTFSDMQFIHKTHHCAFLSPNTIQTTLQFGHVVNTLPSTVLGEPHWGRIREVEKVEIYIAPYREKLTIPLKCSESYHTVFTLQTRQICLHLVSVYQTAPPMTSNISHLIAAYYTHLSTPRRWKAEFKGGMGL